ncbi:FMN-binding negative transcriptional regulator [Chryseolinea soli]|uniref:FMN-binding negative transcriptional regulator n=1 Tax=Chryseolinea soli TaxID=2321403 RepID=A0A385SYV3_9BACT|nr:FMN-binding negative transcriptional regulator [Chryseolinea soli]AYB35297.1 FMN-binding negative transcriptional regulator [Chryseolinea soli]
MYTPSAFLTTDTAEMVAFMRRFSFATIVTVKNNYQTATHLPFLVREVDNTVVLTSHFAKANKQWMELETNPVLVIFSEPHAFISPKHYDKVQNVPTWNYMAVHAYGRGKTLPDPQQAVAVLEQMIETFEASYRQQWDSLPPDFREKAVNGIMAFEITVTELQGKNKLSQNKTEAERHRIIETLSKSDHESERQIAAAMKAREKGS